MNAHRAITRGHLLRGSVLTQGNALAVKSGTMINQFETNEIRGVNIFWTLTFRMWQVTRIGRPPPRNDK